MFCLWTSYHAENLLVVFMTPGPQEPTGSQLQNYLKFIVDDLLKLYQEGIVCHTPGHLEGHQVHVVLLGVICDHLAMCKMCGFADHGHNEALCSKCKVMEQDLFSDESLCNEIEEQNGAEHRQQCFEEKELQSNNDRKAYFEHYGVQWTELAWLPYFDLVWHTIIDPMHNLLLSDFVLLSTVLWYGGVQILLYSGK
ncbi:hypothetical protein PAXRUDRAFT_142245 [Paxillus rubicundulus Ve08.2h10]|uniref:Uncharacterized protein n=1 Tax=Paxillus rubicundulus Ve08.2h10 TaxID=930991 RepID=A0A0D0DXC7_9AGAM|nr:hypothetical protein PAXRUDRAFT_142245 [Paxillus rubicundulus Ve08.2h10]